MTITEAEQLQRNLTDKYVLVQDGVPELRRFQGLTGVVKTVNMSGRALVMFDGPVDIGWYDIDPAYLQVVEKPLPKKAAAHAEKEKPAAKAQPAPAAARGGASPLDMIRKQGAAKAEPAAPAAGGGKPSPLDLIRKQGAAKPASPSEPPAGEAAPEQKAAPAESDQAAPAAPPKGMSPLDLIRQQGAAKR